MSTTSDGESQNSQSSHGSSRPILIGLFLGVVLGIGLQNLVEPDARAWIVKNLLNPIGIGFLRALFMIVVPLVLTSLFIGVAQLGSGEKLGRLGLRIMSFYVLTTLIAILIGQALITTIRPGDGVPRDVITQAQAQFADQVDTFKAKGENQTGSLWPGLVETVIPRNVVAAMANADMLALIFMAILTGIAMTRLAPARAAAILAPAEAIMDICIVLVGWIMKTAPFAVAALVASAISFFGLALIKNVLMYMVVVVLGYLFHVFGTYALIARFWLRLSPRDTLRRLAPMIITAFSTSSSNATIPTTIRTLDKNFGVSEKIISFSVPLGATINQNGTALFEVVAALFIAQVYGIELSVADHFTLVLLVLLTAIGTSGIPGGSIPLLMTAMATVGIPPEGIALILGVDRVLDMGRTVLNVMGDALGAMYLSRVEGEALIPDQVDPTSAFHRTSSRRT